MRATKLAFVGDSLNQTTGMSYVVSSLMKRFAWSGGYEITYVCISGADSTSEGLAAQGEDFANLFKDMKIYNAHMTSKEKAIEFDKMIGEIGPDVVITCHDPWMVDMVAHSVYRDSFVWVVYITIETPRYPSLVMNPSPVVPHPRKSIADTLSRADIIIPHTQMGHDALVEFGLDVHESIFSGLDIEDACERKVSKREAFAGSVKEDDFIFMTMGMNSERKKIDKVVEAFAKFLERMDPKEHYKLYLHTDLDAATGGTDLKSMVLDLGLSDHILISSTFKAGKGVDKKELYMRYKACDCYVGLPAGEGYGYGFAEAMLHGKPVIYIDHGGHTCYCKEAGLPVKVKDYVHARNAYIRWAIADTDDAAKQMSKIVSDNRLRERLGQAGYRIARDTLDWEKTFAQFKDVIDDEALPLLAKKIPGLGMRRVI